MSRERPVIENLFLADVRRVNAESHVKSYEPILDSIWTHWIEGKEANFWQIAGKHGFDEASDDLMVLPFIDTCCNLGLITCTTELINKENNLPLEGSLKEGILFREDFLLDEEENELFIVKIVVNPAPRYENFLKREIPLLKQNGQSEDGASKGESSLGSTTAKGGINEAQVVKKTIENSEEELTPEPSKKSKKVAKAISEKITTEKIKAHGEPVEQGPKQKELLVDRVDSDKDKAKDLTLDSTLPASKSDPINKIFDQAQISPSGFSAFEESTLAQADEINIPQPLPDIEPGNTPPFTIIGHSKTPLRYKLIMASGYVLAALIGIGSVLYTSSLIKKLELGQGGTSVKDMRLMKISDIENLKTLAANEKAERLALEARLTEAVSAAEAKTKADYSEKLTAAMNEARDKGRQEGLSLSESLRDRIALQGAPHAVVSGECEAYGRGNRVDKIYPVNLPVTVSYWLIEPETRLIVGVAATNRELLTRDEGPVSYVKCYRGSADVWPSFKSPVVGSNGQARPIDATGMVVETNPMEVGAVAPKE